ncbi:MAG: hypothetical protein WDA71_04550 [Actinomycetota bacterium]
MDTHYAFSAARKDFSGLYDRVEKGQTVVVERRGSPPLAMVDAQEQAALLARVCPFSVQVRVGRDHVAMWVEGLPLHAQAKDLDSATTELAEELVDYAEDWVRELRHAPNHRKALGFVRRIELAGSVEAVREMLIADAEAAEGAAPETSAAEAGAIESATPEAKPTHSKTRAARP